MDIQRFGPEGPFLLSPTRHGDSRGYFYESYRADRFNEIAGREVTFVQDNQSFSATKGTVRGLHFQAPPRPQEKLVRCMRGTVINIIVDARKDSPTYGEHIRVELSADNHHQLFVPAGFLNGFATQTPDVLMVYKVTDFYVPECDGSVNWQSPELGLDWGVDVANAAQSEKDRNAPHFKDWVSPF